MSLQLQEEKKNFPLCALTIFQPPLSTWNYPDSNAILRDKKKLDVGGMMYSAADPPTTHKTVFEEKQMWYIGKYCSVFKNFKAFYQILNFQLLLANYRSISNDLWPWLVGVNYFETSKSLFFINGIQCCPSIKTWIHNCPYTNNAPIQASLD